MLPLFNLYMSLMSLLTPILSATFPSPRPGPYKNLGYTFITTPALAPWSLKSPSFVSSSRPALHLSNIGYAVYYPSAPPRSGWWGGAEGTVDWLSEPKQDVVRGYERFLGKRAYWLLSELLCAHRPLKEEANDSVQAMKLLGTRMQVSYRNSFAEYEL
jgi:platelet-activating factor acetylhydrolase